MSRPFPLSALAAEARREVSQRRHVYPRLVAAGRMPQAEADLRIARMEAIRDLLARMADGEEPDLFR